MHTGSLPPISIRGTWSENLEIWSIDDDTLMDLSSVTEITLLLRDLYSGFTELTLTMSNGDITIPSPGIIQWRAEQGVVALMNPKLYEVTLILEDADDAVPIILGTISVV